MKRLEFWFCCRELINLQKNEDIIDQNIVWLGASHFFISYTLALKRLKIILLYLSLSFVFVFAHLFPPGSVQWVSVDKAFRDPENSSKLSPQSNPQSNWGESCIWNKISHTHKKKHNFWWCWYILKSISKSSNVRADAGLDIRPLLSFIFFPLCQLDVSIHLPDCRCTLASCYIQEGLYQFSPHIWIHMGTRRLSWEYPQWTCSTPLSFYLPNGDEAEWIWGLKVPRLGRPQIALYFLPSYTSVDSIKS